MREFTVFPESNLDAGIDLNKAFAYRFRFKNGANVIIYADKLDEALLQIPESLYETAFEFTVQRFVKSEIPLELLQ